MKQIKYIAMFFLLTGMFSCELPENINPKEAKQVPATAMFTNATVAFVDQINSTSINANISRLLAQYFAQTTYYGESKYNFLERKIPDSYWNIFYRDILRDLKEARSLTEKEKGISDEVKTSRYAMMDVLEAYVYHVLVDAFGNVPYTEALKGREKPNPKYDDAATIYKDLLERLKKSATLLSNSKVSGFTDADIIYKGDQKSWAKFANSLRFRLAMRLADVNATLSKQHAEEAVKAGIFKNQGESAIVDYYGIPPHTNSLYKRMVEGGRKDYVPSNTIVDTMKALKDPRLAYYFTKIDTSSNPKVEKMDYVGGKYGYKNDYYGNSRFHNKMLEAKFPVTLIDYVEMSFLLAEAAARSYSVGGTTEEHYKTAITESIKAWGGTDAEATAYLNEDEVGYTTGTDANDYQKKIGLQKWIALFNRGVEGWAEWRRFDNPRLNVAQARNYEDIPLRMPYPYDEDNLNLQNYKQAATAIGGDKTSTRLFWDTK